MLARNMNFLIANHFLIAIVSGADRVQLIVIVVGGRCLFLAVGVILDCERGYCCSDDSANDYLVGCSISEDHGLF